MSEQYVKFSLGDISEKGLVTANGCIYPKAVVEKALKKYGAKMIVPRYLKDHLEHPTESLSIRSHVVPEKVPNLFDGIDTSGLLSETDMILAMKLSKDRHFAPRMSGAQLISWDLCQVIDHEG